MSNITFDTEGRNKNLKEDIEWLRIWCEQTNDESLPRVALIGDSITEGYFRFVQKSLEGIASVDYLATSYSIQSDIYNTVIRSFIDDSNYAVIHLNYGLHAYSVDEDTYERRMKALLEYIVQKTSAIVATSTTVVNEDLRTESGYWKGKVYNRNQRVLKIAKELDIPVDDLNAVSAKLLRDNRAQDGVHFSEKGYQCLANTVVENIKKAL